MHDNMHFSISGLMSSINYYQSADIKPLYDHMIAQCEKTSDVDWLCYQEILPIYWILGRWEKWLYIL